MNVNQIVVIEEKEKRELYVSFFTTDGKLSMKMDKSKAAALAGLIRDHGQGEITLRNGVVKDFKVFSWASMLHPMQIDDELIER
jgi:hypothetical protein